MLYPRVVASEKRADDDVQGIRPGITEVEAANVTAELHTWRNACQFEIPQTILQ